MSGDQIAGPPPPPKLDPSSPFYLGNHDRPGDFITPLRLKLDNFADWAHAIEVALRSRRKFGFLDGSITTPAPPATKGDLDTVNCMLVSWLTNTIDAEVKSLLPNYLNPQRLWSDLTERFSMVNGPMIQQLKSDLNDCKQSESMSVVVYYGKLSALWDELDRHEPIISCTCAKCVCNVGKQHVTRRETDRLHKFLCGLLPAKFGSVRSILLTQDPLPTLNRAFQAISQEERVRGMDNKSLDTGVEVAGFAVRFTPPSTPSLISTPYLSKEEKRKLICAHCKKSGHDISMCFDLLDQIPEWWYELKGTKPSKSTGRGRGGRTNTQPVRANVVGASPSTSGPTFESGDWHG